MTLKTAEFFHRLIAIFFLIVAHQKFPEVIWRPAEACATVLQSELHKSVAVCSPPLRPRLFVLSVSVLNFSCSPSSPLPLPPRRLPFLSSPPPSLPLIPSHAALSQIVIARACSGDNDGCARHARIHIGSTNAGVESTAANAESTVAVPSVGRLGHVVSSMLPRFFVKATLMMAR